MKKITRIEGKHFTIEVYTSKAITIRDIQVCIYCDFSTAKADSDLKEKLSAYILGGNTDFAEVRNSINTWKRVMESRVFQLESAKRAENDRIREVKELLETKGE